MEEKEINISAIQMCSKVGDKKSNFKKVSELISRDVHSETDIIILPEVWTVGWSPKHFRESAEFINNSETVDFLSSVAKKYNCWIIGGSFIEKEDDETFYNTCPVINRKGELVCKYSKNHLFSYYGCDEGKFITNGKNPVMVNIEGIKTGLTVCYDTVSYTHLTLPTKA